MELTALLQVLMILLCVIDVEFDLGINQTTIFDVSVNQVTAFDLGINQTVIFDLEL